MSEEVTMWSESLYDSLYVALRRNKPDPVVRGILDELQQKGHAAERIANMVNENVSPGAASRVKRLMGVSTAAAGEKTGPKKKGKGKGKGNSGKGFFAWLGSLFNK